MTEVPASDPVSDVPGEDPASDSDYPTATGLDVDGGTDTPKVPKKPSKKRIIIMLVIGIVVMVGIFSVLLPKMGSYEEALQQLTTMSMVWVAALIIAGLINILAYPYTVLVSVPGLRYWPGFIERQVGFLISCAIPGGGVFAVGAQYRILAFYGVPAARSAAAVSADAVWVYLLTLAMPALGIGLLSIEGNDRGGYGWIAIVGLVAVAVSVIMIAIVLRSEGGARKVAHLAERIVTPFAKRLHRTPPDVEEPIMTFREQAHDLVTTRWKQITLANAIAQTTPYLVLVCALGGLGSFPTDVSLIEIFAAYSVALLLVSIPISPGGLGTVDLALVALLTAYGATGSDAVAADLLWRLVWFLPQILVGLVSGGVYIFGQRRLRHAALAKPA
ncbi:MAG: lysylphosphatidylglycerol synthase transmembrane domain-containing protein [Actinomycetes bacterium]